MSDGRQAGTDARADPSQIMALSTAFWDSQVLLTANRIGLFACLAHGPLDLAAVCAELGTQARPTQLLLKACEALGLVAEQQPKGFVNSPSAAAFLVPDSPGYLGNAIRYSDNLYATWGQLEQGLRTGEAPLASASYLGADAAVTRDFVYGMHDRALGIGRMLVELVDIGARHQLLDVGGGPGTYAALFAQRNPALQAVVLDLPGVVAHTREIVGSMGVAGRVTTLAGSYHETAFPPDNDVVLVSGVLHRESPANAAELIGKATASLVDGGLLLVSDVFTDEGGGGPLFATMFGLNMFLTAPEGGVHADAEVAQWMRAAGLHDVSTRHFPAPMPHRLVVGRRAVGA